MTKKPTPTHTLYLRQFPRDITRVLKSRAALEGTTLPAYLAALLRETLSLKKSA